MVCESEDQLLRTIVSRTQLIKIPKIKDTELANALVQKRGLSLADAEKTAHLADGSYAEALLLISIPKNLKHRMILTLAYTTGLRRAEILNLKLKDKIPFLKWLFLWAFIISYTRIYLGVHYPFDILLGGFIGIIAGWLTWFLIVIVKREILKRFLK